VDTCPKEAFDGGDETYCNIRMCLTCVYQPLMAVGDIRHSANTSPDRCFDCAEQRVAGSTYCEERGCPQGWPSGLFFKSADAIADKCIKCSSKKEDIYVCSRRMSDEQFRVRNHQLTLIQTCAREGNVPVLQARKKIIASSVRMRY
jgi:hypothetical protein